MSTYLDEKLKVKIVEHEGIKPFAYQDTLGYWTIGVGICIDERKKCGLLSEEIFFILDNRIKILKEKLSQYDWYKRADTIRQGVFIELAFNLGINGLLSFKKMLDAASRGVWPLAVAELKDSKWFTQIGKARSADLIFRLQNGQYQ